MVLIWFLHGLYWRKGAELINGCCLDGQLGLFGWSIRAVWNELIVLMCMLG